MQQFTFKHHVNIKNIKGMNKQAEDSQPNFRELKAFNLSHSNHIKHKDEMEMSVKAYAWSAR